MAIRPAWAFVGTVALATSVWIGNAASGASAPLAAVRDPGSSPAYDMTLARYAHQTIDWRPCFDDGTSPDFFCASMTAPMDWGHPGNGDIRIAISRIRATGQRHGILQSNPGGPGIGGVWMPQYLQQAEPQVASHFDLIGMDPRGVLNSTALKCKGTGALTKLYALDGLDHSAATTKRFRQLSRKEAAGCASDPLTPYITTDQTARDIDLVRAVLGERKTSWLGYSAGTWLGAWYATLFPSHVDRFVTDGNEDFTNTWYDSFRTQAAAFQRRFEQDFVPWLAKYDSVLHLGPTSSAVQATYEARRATLAQHPLILNDGSALTGATFDSDIAGWLYSASAFPDLGNAMSIIEHYSAATPAQRDLVAAMFGPFLPGQSDHVFWSILCNDTTNPTLSVLNRDWRTLGTQYPLVGSSWLANPCPYWALTPAGSPVTGKGIPAFLMVQNDGDPATPYAIGLRAHHHTPGSVLLTVRHEGDHTIYGAGDACVEKIVNEWLVRGKLPKHDVACEGIPLPVLGTTSLSRPAAKDLARTTLQSWSRYHR